MNVLKSLWRIVTLPCVEASRLASRALDQPLSRAERAALRAHLVSCAPCRRFRKQLAALSAAAKVERPMPKEARERISQRIEGEGP